MVKKEIIQTKLAPKAIGPYSVATKVSGLIFTAGQLGINPTTGDLVDGGIERETRQALVNLKNVLEEANSSLENVIKTTVFLRDINDFSKMNNVYAEFFVKDYPARSAVQVAALPKNAYVEIEAIAYSNQ